MNGVRVGVVTAVLVVGASLVGFGTGVLVNRDQIDRNCETLRDARRALTAFVDGYAEPLDVVPDADPELVAQVEERNRLFARQRDDFFEAYPPVRC